MKNFVLSLLCVLSLAACATTESGKKTFNSDAKKDNAIYLPVSHANDDVALLFYATDYGQPFMMIYSHHFIENPQERIQDGMQLDISIDSYKKTYPISKVMKFEFNTPPVNMGFKLDMGDNSKKFEASHKIASVKVHGQGACWENEGDFIRKMWEAKNIRFVMRDKDRIVMDGTISGASIKRFLSQNSYSPSNVDQLIVANLNDHRTEVNQAMIRLLKREFSRRKRR